MTILAEHGIIGAILFAAILVWSVREILRLRRESRASPDDTELRSAWLQSMGLGAGLWATLTTGAFLSILLYPVLWVLVAILAALGASQQEALAGRMEPDPPDPARKIPSPRMAGAR
jgi:O-antigen ligase